MEITPACPNHMDPPLHYAGLEALDTLDVLVGATPVSQGGDSLSGSVEAKSRPPVFAQKPGWEVHGKVGAGYDGSNDGKSVSLEAGAANAVLNLRYLGGYQDAGNYDSARGTVADTGYRNERHGINAAYKHGSGVWEFEAGTHHSRGVGTPTLPMDMIKDDANRYRIAFKGDTPIGKLEATAYRHEIDHVMDNFSQRPLTGPAKMQAPSTSNDTGLTLALTQMAGNGILKMGAEIHANDFNVYQQNLTNPAKPTQDIFRDAQRDRYDVYGEWEGNIAAGWRLNAGLRGDFVRMNTSKIINVFAPAAADKTAFNAQDLKRSDSNLDATLALTYALQAGVNLEGALTRKTRSPSVLERYLYTPTAASAGQADGRTYWGNLNLNPEVAHAVSLGINAHSQGVRGKASIFWQGISDFIQGQAVARLDSNGKPVLQYTNVNARLWGGEAELTYVLGAWEMSGWTSLSRGENTDNGDNLYRLAPLRGGLSSTYRTQDWDAGATWLLSTRKDKVAVYNGELPTPGYGVVNLYGRISPVKNLNLTAGVDNVFDKNYYDPLAGVNRVAGGVVPVGGIMPSAGRFGYLKLDWIF
jgi:iron complex outermembrane receptor protein